MPKLTKSQARLLAVRPAWIREMLKKDKVIRIGPIFPERGETETDVRLDRPRATLYRRDRRIKNRIASHSKRGKTWRPKGVLHKSSWYAIMLRKGKAVG